MASMDSRQIPDSWERGDSYERFIGRWSRKVAPLFLAWLPYATGQRWLDLGCGTGALCAAILADRSPSLAVGVEPSAGFLKAARENLAGRVRLYQGSATHTALKDDSVDAVVSGLVLNFIDDPKAALLESIRVTRKGGIIGAYVWDYAGKMEPLRLFWDTAAELNPKTAKLDEGKRFPLCTPEALVALFSKVRLSGIEVAALDLPVSFATFDEYWDPFLGGQGPAPSYLMSLDDEERALFRDRLRKNTPRQVDGSISLTARAWAIHAAPVK